MTDRERNIDDLLKKYLNSATEEDVKLTEDRVKQRLADAIRNRAQEDRLLWGAMGSKRQLAEFELLVLMATVELEGNGDVPAITEKINERLTKTSGTTAVLFTLNRLEGEGLVESSSRKYQVTEEGKRALAAAKAAAEAGEKGAINPFGILRRKEETK